MNDSSVIPETGGEIGLVKLKTKESEPHGVLKYVGSTYSADNDRIYPGVGRKGARIVTFDPILKSRLFPLDNILKYLLELGSKAMNVPVEIEFAAEINSDPDKPDEFRFLQIRLVTLKSLILIKNFVFNLNFIWLVML